LLFSWFLDYENTSSQEVLVTSTQKPDSVTE